MKLLIFLISLMTVLRCSEKKNETRSTSEIRDAVAENSGSLSKDSADKSERAHRADGESGAWRYEKTVDKTGSPVYKASITSSNLLQFEFPYAGGSTATLTIRSGNADSHVLIEVSKGQFNRSFQNGAARVRFDGKSAITYSLSSAANGRANIVFFNSERRLTDQIRASKTMTVEVRFDGQPVRRIEFKTAHLTGSTSTAASG